MKKFNVLVAQEVEVTLDETKFTPEFMEEFRESFYQFKTIEDHAKHLGQLWARGLIGGWDDSFIEGYGRAKEFGFDFEVIEQEQEIVK